MLWSTMSLTVSVSLSVPLSTSQCLSVCLSVCLYVRLLGAYQLCNNISAGVTVWQETMRSLLRAQVVSTRHILLSPKCYTRPIAHLVMHLFNINIPVYVDAL